MTAFADASALVKLYADEPGSAAVRSHEVLVVSAVSRVEVTTALWRKNRIGELAAVDARVLIDAFLADWTEPADGVPTLLPVRVAGAVLDDAVTLCGVHSLRAYDAVQLASARTARRVDAGIDAFLASDRILLRAAAAEGFDVPELT